MFYGRAQTFGPENKNIGHVFTLFPSGVAALEVV
jgi:hypothetical protein